MQLRSPGMNARIFFTTVHETSCLTNKTFFLFHLLKNRNSKEPVLSIKTFIPRSYRVITARGYGGVFILPISIFYFLFLLHNHPMSADCLSLQKKIEKFYSPNLLSPPAGQQIQSSDGESRVQRHPLHR